MALSFSRSPLADVAGERLRVDVAPGYYRNGVRLECSKCSRHCRGAARFGDDPRFAIKPLHSASNFQIGHRHHIVDKRLNVREGDVARS